MEALHSVLKAQFPKPVGHWVVFTTKIAGIDLFACAYAWSQSRVTYFISTTGNTLPSRDTYRTQFEDEFGCVSYKDIPRPVFADLLYDFLPLIDEHNKQRQNILNLERCWPTRNVWFRLIVTIVGMSVVDFHRLYLNKLNRESSLGRTNDKYMDVRKFADLICHPLSKRNTVSWNGKPKGALAIHKDDINSYLKRIENNLGEINRPPTHKQKSRRKEQGNPYTKNCYVCRKYLDKRGITMYHTTQWSCVTCGIPLCGIDRSENPDNPMRKFSCLHEHLMAPPGDPLMCRLTIPPTFPKNHQVPFDSSSGIQHEDGATSTTLQVEDLESDNESSQLELASIRTHSTKGKDIDSLKRTLKPRSTKSKKVDTLTDKVSTGIQREKYKLRKRSAPTRKSKRKKPVSRRR